MSEIRTETKKEELRAPPDFWDFAIFAPGLHATTATGPNRPASAQRRVKNRPLGTRRWLQTQ